MSGKVKLFSLMLLLCAGTVAHADSYEDCRNECYSTQKQCFEGIALYDPAGIKEAQEVCKHATVGCIQACHEIDSMGVEEYQKRQNEAAAAAEEKKRQEEQNAAGGIKTYNPEEEPKTLAPAAEPGTDNPGGGIKTYKFSD